MLNPSLPAPVVSPLAPTFSASKGLNLPTPKWAVPLLAPSRYKGAKGGRSSGKSHFFAERVVEHCICDPDLSVVCIREVQRSLKFSAKRLIEAKIIKMGVSHLFDILTTEIRRIGGSGVIIFEGMQDHTADSIKSLEGFGIAWFEEAQNMSARSLELLLPTIRFENLETGFTSEIWFTWNPNKDTDPVDDFLVANKPDNAIVVHVNFLDNPFCPQVVIDEAAAWLKRNPDSYTHVWLGQYRKLTEAQVFKNWTAEEFEAPEGATFYYGADWGFSVDPTVLLRCHANHGTRTLFFDYEAYGVGVEIDDTPKLFDKVPGSRKWLITADNARPETISYMKRHGFKMKAAKKGKGSVEDGIEFLKSYTIVVHPRCKHLIDELNFYSWKVDKMTGDVLPILVDAHNHCIDAARYALEKLAFNRVQIHIG